MSKIVLTSGTDGFHASAVDAHGRSLGIDVGPFPSPAEAIDAVFVVAPERIAALREMKHGAIQKERGRIAGKIVAIKLLKKET